MVEASSVVPVLVLADTSGSMAEDGKASALTDAISQTIEALRATEIPAAELHIGVVCFGGDDARVALPLQPVRSAGPVALGPCEGRTPLGAALRLAAEMLASTEGAGSATHRPLILLVTDGLPNDGWRGALRALIESPGGAVARRFAIGIGSDRKADVLSTFVGDRSGDDPGAGEVVLAEQADLLVEILPSLIDTVAAGG
jgi:uncharacterized protein YegL